MFLNKNIKIARLEKKMTQKQLADSISKLGRKTSNTAIANWESGLNNPDVDTLQLICQVLHKDANYFFDSFNLADKIDTDGLDSTDIEETKRYINYLKSKKGEK